MYKENLKFQQRLKMIVALAFVPCKFVSKECANLLAYFLNAGVEDCLINFLMDFETMYISNNKFKVGIDGGDFYFIWSVYFNIIDDIFKMSNSLEGWHRSLNDRISKKNPSIVELVQELQN
jgi:hypothetical protein